MLSSPVAVWCAAVEALEQWAASDGEQADAADTLAALAKPVSELSLSAAELKLLFQGMQVPLRLGTACCKAAQQQGGPLTLPLVLGLELISNLLPRTSPADIEVAWEQLQQSGLLHAYPQLLAAAADQLAAAATPAAVTANSTISSTRTSSGGGGYGDDTAMPHVVRVAQRLVEHQQMSYMQDDASSGFAALLPCMVPMHKLALAATHLLTALLPQMQEQQEQDRVPHPASACWFIILGASRATGKLIEMSDTAGVPPALKPSFQTVLQSQQFGRGVALSMAVNALAAWAVQHAAGATATAQHSAGSSSGSSGNGSSGGTPSQPTAWQQANDMLPLLMPCHHKMFDMLGVDPLTMLCTAAAIAQNTDMLTEFITSLPFAAALVADELLHAWATVRRGRQLQRQQQCVLMQQMQEHRALLLLMLSTVLHAASHLPERVPHWDGDVAIVAPLTAAVSQRLFGDWCKLTDFVARQQQQQADTQHEDPWQQPLLPDMWLREVLPQTLKVSGQLLQQLYPPQHEGGGPPAAAPAPAPAGGSSRAQADSLTGSWRTLARLSSFLADVLQFNEMAWIKQCMPFQLRGQQAAHSRPASAVDICQPHATQLITLADGLARQAAATVAAGTPLDSGTKSGLDLLFGSSGGSMCGTLPQLASAAGPGSAAHRHMYSLLASMLKLGSVLEGVEGSGVDAEDIHVFPTTVLAAATTLLAAAAGKPAATGLAAKLVPSLLLYHRALTGCLSLSRAQQQAGTLGPELLVIQRATILGSTQHVLRWLQSGSVAAELSAAGYEPQLMVEAAEQVLAALNDAGDGVIPLQTAYEAANTAFAAFATPAFCNNPVCSNLAGPTELALVSGTLCRCGGCHIARYCSRSCQRAHWKQHKPVCVQLKAVAAAAAAAAAARDREGAEGLNA